MPNADRRGDVRSRSRTDDVVADGEVGLSLENVEGVDVVGMLVRLDALKLGTEANLDHLELGELDQDAVFSGAAWDPLATVRPDCDS